MRLFELFRRPPPIRDAQALADFIDRKAAFLAQKGIYEYSRARAGHYAKVLFASRNSSKPSSGRAGRPSARARHGGGIVEGVLRPYAADRKVQLDALIAVALRCSTAIRCPRRSATEAWSEARAELARRLQLSACIRPSAPSIFASPGLKPTST